MTQTASTVGQELGLADITTLLGHRQLTSIMQKDIGATNVTNHHVRPAAAAAIVSALTGDIWYGVNEITALPADNRRATERTVGRWCAVWADLDYGDSKSGDWDTINAIIDDVTTAYGTEPTYITVSGHGVQPVWVLDHADPATVLDTDEKRATAVALLKRHGRLVQASAAARGVKADSVFDLPRVLRAPGTINHKDPNDPVPASAMRSEGVPLTVAHLEQALTAAGVLAMDSDQPATGEIVAAPSTWQYRPAGAQACKYADDMVRGWATDQPAARHPWLVAQAVRIAAARRHGCFTGADVAGAERELGSRFAALCARGGDTRPVSRFEVEQAIRFGVDTVATMSDARVAEELGGHEHRDHAAEQAYLERTAHELDALRALAAPTSPPPAPPAAQVTDPPAAEVDEAAPPAPPSSPPAVVPAHTVIDPEELYIATVEQIEGAYDFWNSRKSLNTIYRAALAGEASPWAVLTITLLRVITAVPHNVHLPSLGQHGALGSLNLFAGIAAAPGGGKGLANGVAEELYRHPSIFKAAPGSGEGMGHLFGAMVKDPDRPGKQMFQWARHAVLIDAPEIDSLGAIGGRKGSTADSILRQAFSGESLGFSYAAAEKRLHIPAGQYRMCMMVGVQPERAGVLFNGASGGTPQRFIWAPAEDHRVGVEHPDWDGVPLEPYRPEYWADGHVIEVCPQALEEIRDDRRRRGRRISLVPRSDDENAGEELDAHAMYAREKVAVALAVLDGRQYVDADDWELSGCVAAMSTHVRDHVVQIVDSTRLRDAEKRGQERGAELVGAKATAQEIDGARIADTERRVMALIGEGGGEARHRDIAPRISKAQRPYLESALTNLTENGLITHQEIESTRKGGRPGVLYKAVRA